MSFRFCFVFCYSFSNFALAQHQPSPKHLFSVLCPCFKEMGKRKCPEKARLCAFQQWPMTLPSLTCGTLKFRLKHAKSKLPNQQLAVGEPILRYSSFTLCSAQDRALVPMWISGVVHGGRHETNTFYLLLPAMPSIITYLFIIFSCMHINF